MTYTLKTKPVIDKAWETSERLQLLLSNDRSVVITSHRVPMAIMYWNLAFEHHQGLLLLLKNHLPAPAFALHRVVTEAVFRSFLVMFGTDNQFASIKAGTYQTDFAAVAEQIDKKLDLGSLVHARMKQSVKALHGFTHNGIPQLARQFAKGPNGADLVSNYSDKEVAGLVGETTIYVGMNAAFTTEFLNLPVENTKALETFAEFMRFMQAEFPEIKAAASSSL